MGRAVCGLRISSGDMSIFLRHRRGSRYYRLGWRYWLGRRYRLRPYLWRQPAVITLGKKIGHERFHFHGEHFHFFRKVNEPDQTRHRDSQSEHGAVKGFRNSAGYLLGVGRTRTQTEAGEDVDQAGDRPDQANQWR